MLLNSTFVRLGQQTNKTNEQQYCKQLNDAISSCFKISGVRWKPWYNPFTYISSCLQVLQFDRSSYNYPFVGIDSASVAVNITCDNNDVTMKKHVSVQLPIIDDEEEKDTELVVVRYSDTAVQVHG